MGKKGNKTECKDMTRGDDNQEWNGEYNMYLTLPPMTLPKSNLILCQG